MKNSFIFACIFSSVGRAMASKTIGRKFESYRVCEVLTSPTRNSFDGMDSRKAPSQKCEGFFVYIILYLC